MDTIKDKIEVLEKEAEKVCHDFDVFCEYMIEKKVKLTRTKGEISKKDCFELNRLFAVKELYEMPCAQRYYPVINFLYYFAVRNRILESDITGCYLEPGDNYGYYKEAAVLEKFLLLLMSVFFDGRFSKSWLILTMRYFMKWAEEKSHASIRCISFRKILPEIFL